MEDNDLRALPVAVAGPMPKQSGGFDLGARPRIVAGDMTRGLERDGRGKKQQIYEILSTAPGGAPLGGSRPNAA